jgi:hypothetical protein
MTKVFRRRRRLLGALGLAFLALMWLPMGIIGIVGCSRPPLCSEDGAGMASTSLLFGFLSLLGAGRLAFKALAGVRHEPEARARPRYGFLRNLAEVALQAVFAITGIVAAMMLGPAALVITSGPAAERSEGIVMALVSAPAAFGCFLVVWWLQRRIKRK